MKFLVPVLGFLAAGVVCFVCFVLISKYQISQLGYTPSQSDSLIDIFILVVPFISVGGAWLSYHLYRKHLTKG